MHPGRGAGAALVHTSEGDAYSWKGMHISRGGAYFFWQVAYFYGVASRGCIHMGCIQDALLL